MSEEGTGAVGDREGGTWEGWGRWGVGGVGQVESRCIRRCWGKREWSERWIE